MSSTLWKVSFPAYPNSCRAKAWQGPYTVCALSPSNLTYRIISDGLRHSMSNNTRGLFLSFSLKKLTAFKNQPRIYICLSLCCLSRGLPVVRYMQKRGAAPKEQDFSQNNHVDALSPPDTCINNDTITTNL